MPQGRPSEFDHFLHNLPREILALLIYSILTPVVAILYSAILPVLLVSLAIFIYTIMSLIKETREVGLQWEAPRFWRFLLAFIILAFDLLLILVI